MSKVKSIVEWIKTGGKNNREVLERLEKRYRDHFRHKEHTQNTEENKRKSIQYIPQ